MDIKELYKLYQQHPCITTDSRNCPEGSIFLALKGASFDGNQYALSALEKGCAYAIIDNPEYKKDNRIILVDDCLQTFKDLAREHRRQFEIPVVGITGTNGKTTTKELIQRCGCSQDFVPIGRRARHCRCGDGGLAPWRYQDTGGDC